MLPKICAILFFVALIVETSQAQVASRVYAVKYSDPAPYAFYACNLDGSGAAEIELPMRPRCLAVDWKSMPQKLYIALVPVSGAGKIIRCNTDGSNQEDVISNASSVSDIELDLDNRQIFWLQNTWNDDQIFRADMDGLDGHITSIYATTITSRDLWGLALDVPNRRLWITERGSTSYNSYIRSMSFSGSNKSILVCPVDNPHDIEYCDGKLYWSDRAGIIRATPEGAREDTVIGNVSVYALSIDGTNQRIYWAEVSNPKIKRVDLTGSNPMELAGDFFSVTGLDVDYNPSAADVKLASEQPERFEFEQNYPNPFNPSTRIQYTVGVAGGKGQVASVKLVVYDLLGREVAVLVNEKKAPGTYEVNFDGSGLASGVYLYRLSAGSYVQTRKMVLVR